MKAKINEKILCIPPYLSTTWDQVLFLNADEDHESTTENKKMSLKIHLIDGKIVTIRDLEPSLVDITFSAHMQFLDRNEKAKTTGIQNLINDQMMAFPIRFGISSMPPNMEGFDMAMQHNQAQANSPNLPPEVIDKIASIAKVITNGDLASFPKPEPHCNCMHCQVARAIHKISDAPQEIEEMATDEDLKFRSWDIMQTGDKLFTVSNPIDPKEQYNVYLGSPVGCTCGSAHCEHIKAVLFS